MPKAVVHSLKFGRAQAAAKDIAAAMAASLETATFTAIVPVPTVSARVRKRGYDQAALIARELARLTGLPYASLLIRTGGSRQVGHTRIERRQQMERAFRAVDPAAQYSHVLLIDDVITTGATCEAAARTLRQAGVASVSAAVFAAA
ncbi:MAG TPA: phosphoribosyltransferase family protein [Candidatus Saccharimonadales bacterium]|nr:phosphoribosyltransferase family protein [Candidatus Saccharimonadales bacterium]